MGYRLDRTQKKRAEHLALPSRTTTRVAARGALPRCPILRAGKEDYTINDPNRAQKPSEGKPPSLPLDKYLSLMSLCSLSSVPLFKSR